MFCINPFWVIGDNESSSLTSFQFFCVLARSQTEPVSGSFYTTCDFDLDDIEALLPFLPSLCTEIYANRLTDAGLYNSYLQESKAFANFQRKLNDYELRSHQNQQAQEQEPLNEYPFATTLRQDIYGRIDLIECVTSVNGSARDFLKCVMDKHLELEQLVPNVTAIENNPNVK